MKRQPLASTSSYYEHLPHFTAYNGLGQHHDPTAFTTVGYRPLHLPLLQQRLLPEAPAAPAEQLSLAQLASHHLALPSCRRQHLQHLQSSPLQQQQQSHQQQPRQQAQAQAQTLPVRTRHQNRRPAQPAAITSTSTATTTMASYQQLSEQELAELQKASNEYEPEAEGPLVGQREPCTKITSEYANADPIYQTKTAALPQKYSHYRTVRGDGRCGWRAIAFGYFEALVRLGDSNKFTEEEARLRSLSNILNAAGFDPFVYEDFAEDTFLLLRKANEALHAGNADDILMENFNDDMVQNYITTHLKTLTSAWMRTRPSEYAPWLLGQTVEQYCDLQVMPITAEIENVSLSALKDVLLSPAGIALEVLYLDRTEGSEANMHRFDPVNNHGGITIGTIRLLYRPGHYDILYKAEDFPQSVTTYLQFASPSHDEHVQDIAGWDFMAAIPGGSLVHNAHQAWMSGSIYTSGAPELFTTPSTLHQCVQPIAPAVPAPIVIPESQVQPQSTYFATTTTTNTSAPLVAPPNELSQELPLRGVPSVSFVQPGFQNQLGSPFRPSAWQLEDGFMQAAAQMPNFQTSIFRNSHFNTAHFLNPDFQPEEWKPDDEYLTADSKRARHKNNG